MTKIEKQKEDAIILTDEIISGLKRKDFYSGRKKESGDMTLYALLSGFTDELIYTLIDFHEDEFGVLYELVENEDNILVDSNIIPRFKLL